MKHLTLILSTIFAVTAPAVAADKLSVPWGKLWGHVTNRQLTVTTTDQPVGYHGHFLRFESDTLVLEQAGSPGQLLKIARQKITKIRVDRQDGRNMARLVQGTKSDLHGLLNSVFSPAAPVGLVGTPVVAAYFVAVTPFCALGDLFARHRPPLDIEIVD